MRGQDNEFFVDLEHGAIRLDERFKEVTGSKKPRAPYFEKTMQLDSGVKVVVSGSVDPQDNTISRNLRVAVSRSGGLKDKDVDEVIRMILDAGLRVTAVSTKKPGVLRDKLNNHLLKYTASREREELVANQILMGRVEDLMGQIAAWEKKHSGYLNIPLVKANVVVKGGFNAKLNELKERQKNGPKDAVSLKRLIAELAAFVALLPEHPRNVKELKDIPQKMQGLSKDIPAVKIMHSKESVKEVPQAKEQEIQRLRAENAEYLETINVRAREMDRFINKLDQLGQGKKVSESIRMLVADLKDLREDVRIYSEENKNKQLRPMQALNSDLRAMVIVMPEVLPKDTNGITKQEFSEREIKQGLKDIKNFPKDIVRFIEQTAKPEGSSKVRLPSWSRIKEKISEKLPGLVGTLAKLSKKKKGEVSQETEKGSDTGLRDSTMKK